MTAKRERRKISKFFRKGKMTVLPEWAKKGQIIKFKFKRIAAMILAEIMTANMGAAAFAESESANDSLDNYLNETLPQVLSEENVNILDTIREYASQTIPYYLPTFELYDEYEISEPIRIHNWDGGEDTEKYLVIVSKNNVMVGSLTAEYVENRVISAFRAESIPEINAALASGAEIQLGYSSDCFLVYSQNKMTVVDNPYFVDESFTDELAIDPALSEAMCTSETVAAAIQTRSGSWSVSGVKTVANAKNDSGVLLCWAACVASMGMQKNRTATYTARGIYDLCVEQSKGKSICTSQNSSHKPTNVPHGCSAWELYALDLVGIPAVYTIALTANQVANLLGQGKPIMVGVHPTSDTSTGYGHSLVLYHYTEISSSSGQYIFMDPGTGTSNCGITSVMIDASVMNNGANMVLASRVGVTYHYWKESFYASN